MSAPHNAATIADYVENARKAVAEGYDCIKIDFFTFAPEDGHRYTDEDRTRLLPPEKVHMIEERVAAVREAIGPMWTSSWKTIPISMRSPPYSLAGRFRSTTSSILRSPILPIPRRQIYQQQAVHAYCPW